MSRPSRKPAIHLTESEADRLADLAVSIEKAQPALSELLMAEIDRAKVHPDGKLPKGVVAMLSTVEFVDEGSGATRTVQLVYPPDASIADGRISILTPVGAGLIGLSEGQSIEWPDRDGHKRALRIVKVS
ncbi:nucleoside diphosphate kinase regulator [uncultured Sphingomonas sp.]|uniref:nucleoside diphosphate kinase regulator n=1 Tax=uncultured Sphingomonas sp. TaxID=158754 RepID=UPI002616477A|nr:nucleoside diphosphate kinase regulator [uncultured Sphingomonas sp.]